MDKKSFFVLASAIFGSMVGQGIITPFLPLYAQTMGATGLWVGLIFGAFSYSRLFIMPFSGPLSDRTGRKWFLVVGLAGFSLISLGYILASNLYYLVLVRFLQGAASAIILPIARAYIGDLCPEGEEGRWTGYANAAFFAGFASGPLIGGLLSDWWGQNAAFIAMGILNFLGLLLVLLTLPDIKPRRVAEIPRLSIALRTMGSSKTIWGLLGYRSIDAICRGSFFAFLAIFATSAFALSESFIGMLLAVHVGVTALTLPYWGHLADRLNRTKMVIIGSIFAAAFYAFIPLMPNWWLLLALCAMGGIVIAIVMPALEGIIINEGRIHGMGTTMSMLMVSMSIGMAVGPTISGNVFDNINIDWVFYLCGMMELSGTVLFYLLTRHAKQIIPKISPNQIYDTCNQ